MSSQVVTRKNPILELLDNCGTKPAEFALRAGMSRQAVDYYLNGVYPRLSEELLDDLYMLCEDNGVRWHELQQDYQAWRLDERFRNSVKYQVRPRPVWTDQVSPFDTYVSDTAGNRSRFAKDLKVPVRDVTRYARGEALAMPLELQQAFDDIEFPHKAELIAMQYNWRTEHK